MKLREYKNKTKHYFGDEQGRLQGEYKSWYESGQRWIICHYRNGKIHGEFKDWYPNGHPAEISHHRNDRLHGEFRQWNLSGELFRHRFFIDGEELVDFLKNPELYPETPEGRTYFALKYGIGGARFIK